MSSENKYKEYDFQRTSIEFGKKNKYCILALRMGLGKSMIAIKIAVETNSKALVVVPSYLKLKWKAEIEKFAPGSIVSIFNSPKDFYKPWDSDFCILPYSMLSKNPDLLFEWANLVIYDECHFLKSIDTQRSDAAHRLIYENSIERCLLLSGSPIKNQVYEFYSLLALCNYNPEIEESAFLKDFPSYPIFANHFSYLREFTIMRGGKRVKIQKWEGFRNGDDLKKYLENCYIRFDSDVLDLPPIVEIEVPMELEDRPELLVEFNKFMESENAETIGSRVKAEAALAKTAFTIEYVKNILEQGEQVVVYSDHVLAAESIATGLGVTAITGMTPMYSRMERADRFQAGETKVIVATIGSFSTGVDLIAASNMVINDLPFVPGDLDQIMYRIRRIGQKRTCNFHFIFGTYQDYYIKKILDEKIKTINEALAI